eukprot:6470134-Amphidinium_carterae.1
MNSAIEFASYQRREGYVPHRSLAAAQLLGWGRIRGAHLASLAIGLKRLTKMFAAGLRTTGKIYFLRFKYNLSRIGIINGTCDSSDSVFAQRLHAERKENQGVALCTSSRVFEGFSQTKNTDM